MLYFYSMCMCTCLNALVCANGRGGWKSRSDPLELELQVVVTTTWVLGIKPGALQAPYQLHRPPSPTSFVRTLTLFLKALLLILAPWGLDFSINWRLTCHVTKTNLKLLTLLPLPPKWWDMQPYPYFHVFLLQSISWWFYLHWLYWFTVLSG